MIELDGVTVHYPDRKRPVLRDVDLTVDEGELCLVIGSTGSGKSTLLGAVNGLVPHFTGGTLGGRVLVDGRDTRTHPPRELADLVGVVGQDPRSTFVTDLVTDELAYTMESLALPVDVMRRRIEDVLDLLSLTELRDRSLASLSGGQAQRVAIGAVLTAHPKVLVLDEPTSALDPAAAEEVLAVLQRLVHDNGLTVLLAEHRLERVLQYADTVIRLPGDGTAVKGDPATIIADSPVFPSVVGLGRLAGWQPVPLSVRDARRSSARLRSDLPPQPSPRHSERPGTVVAQTRSLTVRYQRLVALDAVNLSFRGGEITALMGRNGAGKSTLLSALTGLVKPAVGTVLVGGSDPRSLSPRRLIRAVGLVPQQPADLLYADSVAAECRAADSESDVAPGTCARLFTEITGQPAADGHPRDLSEGQRVGLALAVVLTAAPALLLLDEPTRGLDYPAKARLVTVLRELAATGHGIVLATHDVELAAELADRTVVIADGAVLADGPTREVVVHSPVFAPQVAKVLSPLPYLTVADVARTLGRAG
ncbi:MAG TPA: ATP-binding cassette domain-containing protein [Jatrophihabitans sp.]